MTLPIREARRYVYAAAIVLIVLDLVAAGILLSPWGRSRAHLQERLQGMQRELQIKLLQVGPLRGMDKKLVTVASNTNQFYDQRLPGLYSEIDEALGTAERESGVRMTAVRYAARAQTGREEVAVPEGLRQVNIVLTISGQYVEDVRFINALERSKVFFVIQSVRLAGAQDAEDRSGGGRGNVGLQLEVETYLRRGAA